jgi:hypothetical protein
MEVMARMRKLTTLRSLAVAVAALVLITGCAGSGKAPVNPVATIVNPTGAPSGLTQIEGAKGEQVPLGDGLGAVVPAGSKSEPVDSDEHGKSVIYRMPDVDVDRLPYLKVAWGSPVNTGAREDSWGHEVSSKRDPAISNYKRSIVKWPGAKAAVVVTWTEKIDLAAGPGTVDRLAIWVETPSGAVDMAIAAAVSGKLDGSTSLDALRTLTVR